MYISSAAAKKFTNGGDFLSFMNEREKHTVWEEVDAKSIHFDPLLDEPLMAPAVAAKYGANQEAIEECMDPAHSGVLCKVGPEYFPVGDSAIGTIRERMQVRKGFWVRQHADPNILAKDLNSSFGMMTKGKVLVKVGDEMVRAIHSPRYQQIPVSKVYELAQAFLREQFPAATFSSGYFSHDFSYMLFDLSMYKKELFGKSRRMAASKNVMPALYVQTSDVATSSVTIRPVLVYGKVMAPLAVREDTRHLGSRESIVNRVQTGFQVAMAKFTDAISEVEKLDAVKLKNPYNALKRAFVAIKWPKAAKRQALESAENFQQMLDGSPMTAYDAYLAILDAMSFYTRDNKNADTERLMDSVARSIKIDWSACDLPGEFSY